VTYEHGNDKPQYVLENWEGKWKVFSWLEFACAIPHVLFMVTTLKENGLPNAAFQSWSSFTGEGEDYFVIMSGVMKHTHTYDNIMRNKEFCVNFVADKYLENCWNSIHHHDVGADEISAAGFTAESSKSIGAPRISEGFLKMECSYEWDRELVKNGHNSTICGRVKHVSIASELAKAATKDKYGKDSFMVHLHNPMNPFTGEHLGGGIGTIQFEHGM
jgi:flavin reductase (DIM6/NTAB) family NADH-FMN oxidoreductase RutF